MSDSSRRLMTLPVELTQDEVLARGKELARMKDTHTSAQDHLAQAQLAWKGAKESIQGEIDDAEADMRRLARTIRSGREDREVEVWDKPDYKAGLMATVRVDTGELVATRGLTDAERQRSMFKDEAAAGKAKAKPA